jgi:hypothetical protein
MLTKKSVLERPGWTLTLIDRLLGEPDARRKVRGQAHPLCLYDEARVEATEASDAFTKAQEAIARRKASAQKGVATKTAKLLDQVRAMEVTVHAVPGVQARAIEDYNARQERRAEWYGYANDTMPANVHSDRDFLERITVNYIRHSLTEYDEHIESVASKTGINAAIEAIRARVYGAIAEAYPWLASECRRQQEQRSAESGSKER